MKRLSPKQQATLRKSQQQWLKYRDTEGNAILEIVSSQQGTIHQLSGTNLGMQLVRARARKLIFYSNPLDKFLPPYQANITANDLSRDHRGISQPLIVWLWLKARGHG